MTRGHTGLTTSAIATAFVIAGFIEFSGPSRAADLAGDCCADLEERIAELEGTTVRKGNHKVSLTVSGYVAQEITWWDDGGKKNAYLYGLGPTQATHVKFTGQAQITPGWTASYVLRIQNLTDNPFARDASTGAAMNQFNEADVSGLPAVQQFGGLSLVSVGGLINF